MTLLHGPTAESTRRHAAIRSRAALTPVTTQAPASAHAGNPATLHRQPAGLQRHAITTLQRLHGNAHVQRSLHQARVQRLGAATPTLSMGSRGPAVTSLQQGLNAAGASVATDGIFGAGTRAAVVSYQQSTGLTADGVVGPQTWQRLHGAAGAGSGAAAAGPGDAMAAQTPPDPLQAVVAAKIGQVRAALQGVKATGKATPKAAAGADGERAVKPVAGHPVPMCAIPVPDGDQPALSADGNGPTGTVARLVQRSFLDDAAEWAGDAADAATDWAGEQIDDATQAVSDAATWVDEQVSAAGDWVNEQAEAAGEAIGDAADWVADEAKHAAQSVGELVESAKEIVDGGLDALVQTGGELAKEVGEFSDDLKRRYANEIAILNEVIQELGKPFGDLGGLIKRLDDILAGLAKGGATAGIFGFFEDDPKPPVKVYAVLDIAGSITRGGVKVPGGTGYSEPKYSISEISWTQSMDDIVFIQAKVNVDCHWDIASAGRGTSITGANDPAVTEISYLTVIHDLEELSESYLKDYKVSTTYWSEPIVERHELFHCHDYIQQATRYIPTAQSWLESQEIDPNKIPPAALDQKVHDLTAEMRKKIEDDGLAYFKNGGEARAYGDGKASYDALIAQIRARAKAAKWK